MKALSYPFDSEYILKKAKHLKKELLALDVPRLEKRIAVLGGATTRDVVRILELFLLDAGIAPVFYESEYGKYLEDALFPPKDLIDFHPDIVYLHTTEHNLTEYPVASDDEAAVTAREEAVLSRFSQMWEKIKEVHGCPVIQNNFEYPSWRLYGNRDAWDIHGRVRFINALNTRFARYAAEHEGFYINDIHYLSSLYGLEAWSDPSYWYMYKYAPALPAVPLLSHNIARIIKSVFGKNKKTLVLDLDNTLWGGVIGDDGAEGIVLGTETAQGEAYTDFQAYVRAQKDIGVILNVASKNNEENALAGLAHPDSVLKKDDFLYIRANWDPKSENVLAITKGMNILPEAVVFADDNPAERDIVETQLAGVAAPPLVSPETYIRTLDRAGYFEVTNLSADDLKRGEMYKENLEREALMERFTDYHEYLLSLEMEAEIAPFAPVYFERIAQLTNKSNQYNLTTKRYTVDEIKNAASDVAHVTLYGRLTDKFGDNGVVALMIARIEDKEAHIELSLMSCRVLKRDMEYAMMDAMISACAEKGVETIYGYYYPTAKNKMVEDYYELQGFTLVRKEDDGSSIWRYNIADDRGTRNTVIRVSSGETGSTT